MEQNINTYTIKLVKSAITDKKDNDLTKEKFTEDVASLVMELSTAKLAILYTGNGEKCDYLSKKMLNMSNYAL